jgi:myo-inositol-hexaphosphate 3-phosphohydrolase
MNTRGLRRGQEYAMVYVLEECVLIWGYSCAAINGRARTGTWAVIHDPEQEQDDPSDLIVPR